jgi:diguanylate cyclase (GGDEF)-like protein
MRSATWAPFGGDGAPDGSGTAFAALTGGFLLIAGALLSLVLTASFKPDVSPPVGALYRPLVYIVDAVALLFGLGLLAARDRTPGWVLAAAPAISCVLICLPAAVTQTTTLTNEILLTWPVLYAGYLLPEPVAWGTLAFAAASFAAVAIRAVSGGGTVIWVEVCMTLLFTLLVTVSMRRRIAALVSRLRSEARTDPLTGLPNLRAFVGVLERELVINERHGDPVSLLALDVDNFKRINDVGGHPAGDEALRSLGRLLKESVRRSDVVARIGGEEFAALLPDCPLSQAMRRADDLREAVREGSRQWPYPLTVSIGAATVPESVEPYRAAVRRYADADGSGAAPGSAAPDHVTTAGLLRAAADAALYAAKAAGRDTVKAAERDDEGEEDRD